jgi:hypothetical protein
MSFERILNCSSRSVEMFSINEMQCQNGPIPETPSNFESYISVESKKNNRKSRKHTIKYLRLTIEQRKNRSLQE